MKTLKELVNEFNYVGEFLDNSDLMDLLTYSNCEFSTYQELIDYLEDNDGNYISDNISELADSKADVYYYDLRKWAVDNYTYIEDAINEFGVSEDFDFHRAIQQGQYYAYSNEFYTLVSEFKEFIEDNYNDEEE